MYAKPLDLRVKQSKGKYASVTGPYLVKIILRSSSLLKKKGKEIIFILTSSGIDELAIYGYYRAHKITIISSSVLDILIIPVQQYAQGRKLTNRKQMMKMLNCRVVLNCLCVTEKCNCVQIEKYIIQKTLNMHCNMLRSKGY